MWNFLEKQRNLIRKWDLTLLWRSTGFSSARQGGGWESSYEEFCPSVGHSGPPSRTSCFQSGRGVIRCNSTWQTWTMEDGQSCKMSEIFLDMQVSLAPTLVTGQSRITAVHRRITVERYKHYRLTKILYGKKPTRLSKSTIPPALRCKGWAVLHPVLQLILFVHFLPTWPTCYLSELISFSCNGMF